MFGGPTANGVPIIQYQPHQGLNQQWELIRLYNGNYLIVNDASGKALDDPGLEGRRGLNHPVSIARGT